MINISELFKNYGITGNPYIDSIIIANMIPFLIGYITIITGLIKKYSLEFISIIFNRSYNKFKSKIIGETDIKLCVKNDKSIYPIIYGIFFSSNLKSDEIDAKTIGMLSIITESKEKYNNHYKNNNVCDLYLDSNNNIVIEKMVDGYGAIHKKFFKYKNYYIVVSENKKKDLDRYYMGKRYMKLESKKTDKVDDKNDPDDYFIMFEAVRIKSSIPKDNEILNKFLYDRFKIKARIPYQYCIKIENINLYNKMSSMRTYIDSCRGEDSRSEGISKFLSNPKVRDYYSSKKQSFDNISDNSKNISSSTILNHDGNYIDTSFIENELRITENYEDNLCGEIFNPSFHSIMKYFYGKKFDLNGASRYSFMFKDNKIILLFGIPDKSNKKMEIYICVISFRELISKKDICDVVKILLTPNQDEKDKSKSNKIKIYNYVKKSWELTECDSRSDDTIYLPRATKCLIISEMNKFVCFENVYKEIGVPYKKGFLFYGPPGTGKTSLVRILANIYNIPVYIIDVNSEHINDETMPGILNSISGTGNRIVLFEDIDSAFADKEQIKNQSRVMVNQDGNPLDEPHTDTMQHTMQQRQKFLTYSGLLNSLDGVLTSQHGTVVIMTTNHIEKLGSALIRPGRIDFSIELTYCDRYQIVTMSSNIIKRSYDVFSKIVEKYGSEIINDCGVIFNNPHGTAQLDEKIEIFADNLMCGETISKVKPCELQVYILKYIENVDKIFDNYQELLDIQKPIK